MNRKNKVNLTIQYFFSLIAWEFEHRQRKGTEIFYCVLACTAPVRACLCGVKQTKRTQSQSTILFHIIIIMIHDTTSTSHATYTSNQQMKKYIHKIYKSSFVMCISECKSIIYWPCITYGFTTPQFHTHLIYRTV